MTVPRLNKKGIPTSLPSDCCINRSPQVHTYPSETKKTGGCHDQFFTWHFPALSYHAGSRRPNFHRWKLNGTRGGIRPRPITHWRILSLRRGDMKKGAPVLDGGHKIGPREIAACAAAGADRVNVLRRLRVALIVTGDEVRETGCLREIAHIWDVNTPMLTAALHAAGVEIVATAHGADNCARVAQKLGDMAANADLIVTTGGISVGEEDHVIPAFASLGGEMLFSRVAIKPGKPVSLGRIGTAFWLGLPGNPLSAYVTWHVFGTALVRGLVGQTLPLPATRHVVTNAPIRHKPGRCELRLATLCGSDANGHEIIDFEDATHSARVKRLPMADGLMRLPADVEHLPAGALAEFQPFCSL